MARAADRVHLLPLRQPARTESHCFPQRRLQRDPPGNLPASYPEFDEAWGAFLWWANWLPDTARRSCEPPGSARTRPRCTCRLPITLAARPCMVLVPRNSPHRRPPGSLRPWHPGHHLIPLRPGTDRAGRSVATSSPITGTSRLPVSAPSAAQPNRKPTTTSSHTGNPRPHEPRASPCPSRRSSPSPPGWLACNARDRLGHCLSLVSSSVPSPRPTANGCSITVGTRYARTFSMSQRTHLRGHFLMSQRRSLTCSSLKASMKMRYLRQWQTSVHGADPDLRAGAG